MRQLTLEEARFDGETYEEVFDCQRLKGQIRRVYDCMADGNWRTLREISYEAHAPEASVSARLRDLRKSRFGSHKIERRRRGEPSAGIWEYAMIDNPCD